MSDLIGKSLGRYRILEQIGEGGMATVYKARDTRLEADVAVKVIRTENLAPSVLERALKRFEREAKALARLTHPNIVKVMDYGEYEGKPYLVMPFFPGGSLKKRLGKPIPWQEALQLILPSARALDYAHRQNMIHRDVKPSNILMTEDGEPMLTDFGIAKVLDFEETVDLTGTGMGIGTPEYMAPEQWQGNTSTQSDLYSLGVVLYEMITGRKPYTANTPAAILLKQANEPLPRPNIFVTDLPEKVERILVKALVREPKERYKNMGELVVALDESLNREKSPFERATRPPAPKLVQSATSLILQENTQSKVSENISGECPICGKLNQREVTFRCQKCQRAFICLTHQDKRSYICSDCEAPSLLKRKRIDSVALGIGVFSVLFSMSMSGGSAFGLDFVGFPIVVAMISLILGVLAVENKGKKGWWGIALSFISGVILWVNFLLHWNSIW